MTTAQAGGPFPVSRPGIVAGFPPPPGQVKYALGRVARKVEAPKTGDADADAAELARLEAEHEALPRPWIPASCPPLLRRRVWHWLDQVATWLNRDYLWRPDKMIPPCWVAHPHIVHELAVLSCLRHSAEREFDPKALEEWHRYTLPMFIDRMHTRLSSGQNTQLCETNHDKWPGLPAYIRFTDDENQHNRYMFFDRDTDDDTADDTADDSGGDRGRRSDASGGSNTAVVDQVTGVVTDPNDPGPSDPGPSDPGPNDAGLR